MRIRLDAHRSSFLKCNSHQIPYSSAVYRFGDSLISKSEFLIIRDLFLQAGQDDTAPPLYFRIADAPADQLSGTPPIPVFRYGIESEDHLPGSPWIMERGIGKHLIRQFRRIGDHPVQKSDQRLSVPQKPESFRT